MIDANIFLQVLSFFSKKQPPNLSADKRSDCSLRVLFVLPCSRTGATGQYTQILAKNLEKNGCGVLVLAEGAQASVEDGVEWLPMDFEGAFLSNTTRSRITAFGPDIIYENGVRSKAQRAALEALYLTGAKLVMHSEDDDVQVYGCRNGFLSAEDLTLLDRPFVKDREVACFLAKMDWLHTWKMLKDPSHDRWVEPLTRSACYHLAAAHTAIWKPFEQRLKKQYRKPTLVIPPVCEDVFFDLGVLEESERANVLKKWRISPGGTVFFVAGAVYPYSEEFEVFIEAMNFAKNATCDSLVVVVSGTGSREVIKSASRKLSSHIQFVNIGKPEDEDYIKMLQASDLICSPGICDDFNLYRLPSRLVKAMAMGKPILTAKWGFGNDLRNECNAFLTDGNDPQDWAKSILSCLDAKKRASVGIAGKNFAERNFRAGPVCKKLVDFFRLIASKG